MRLEQRIGRLDRIGQTHVVRALNFVLEDTVEHRVQEVLVEKLKLILAEFGVDKTSDVLDSVQAERLFDELYIEAIRQPDHLDDKIEAVVREIQEQAYTARDRAVVTGLSETFGPELAERVLNHPLPHWLERMTVSYLAAHGGQAERRGTSWHLRWPDGETVEQAVFTAKEAVATPTARHLSLSEDRLRELVTRLPPFVAGQPIPCLNIPGLPEGLRGFWSLWRITLHARDWSQQRLMPLFLRAEDQRLFLPTARFIWDQLLQNNVEISRYIESAGVFEPIQEAAETQGQTIYEELVRNHQDRLRREQEKGAFAFDARRQALDRIGLPAVRAYRLARLTEEETVWREQLVQRSPVSPELVALLVIQVTGNG